jgi:hypothetical protein
MRFVVASMLLLLLTRVVSLYGTDTVLRLHDSNSSVSYKLQIHDMSRSLRACSRLSTLLVHLS